MTTTVNAVQESKYWKQIFFACSILLLIVMPFLSRDYGQSGDEWLQIEYGQHIWNYFTKGDQQALDYTNHNLQYTHQEYYGGMFDFPMDVLHEWFPSIPILIIRHFFNALLGALMMIFTGLLARRLSGKWSVGLIALLFIAFSPRIFGESMNNPKDIPFASGFIITIYFLVAMLQDFPAAKWKHAIGLGLGFALAFGVRSAGGLLLGAYIVFFIALYWLQRKKTMTKLFEGKTFKQFVLFLISGLAAGYVLGLLTWPWGLQSPIGHPLESLKGMTNREAYLRVLFDGQYYMSNTLPKMYEFKWIFISNPLVVIAGCLLFALLSFKIRKESGLFPLVVIAFGALFPLVYMIYKNSTVYDTWRHVFFVYPFWVVAGAFGWDILTTFIKNEKQSWIPNAVAIAGLLPAIIWTVRSHPNQYVYFNELQGGAKGAYGYYDLDYYQNSGKQAADWIEKNIKPIPGKKILLRSNMGGFNNYLAKDTSWIVYGYGRYNERHSLDWDYYVAYPRYISTQQMQEGKWKFGNAVHTVEIDGVPLCTIIKRTSTAGIAAKEAYDKKDYVTANQKYAEYLATDTSDEFAYFNYGISLASAQQYAEAIVQIKKAAQIDPSRPDFFDALAQLYSAIGDKENAQKAEMTKNELVQQQQDEAGE
ncbi:MAG: glycosyltransferase family 39 protein [Bacteroidetes bacterium]|nr:glycosyltransferase family 39 protein [Bacteroidota bacterium]